LSTYLHNESHCVSVWLTQHKSFDKMPCPIARSLEQVGEWWSILIIRDAFAWVHPL